MQALGAQGIIVQTLELKIPPVILVLVTASLMWTLAVAVPSLGFTLLASLLAGVIVKSGV